MAESTLRPTSAVPSREALLRIAKASPELADAHEKERWLALYADDAIVEDPVGTPASHKGRRPGRLGDELGRFYEAFIAASGIEIVARRDIVSDMHVFRAVDIHTTNLKTGLKMVVPAYLLYEIVERDGSLLIRRMQAHWELGRMSRRLMGQGLLGARTIGVMNWRMLRAFGPRWLMRYFQSSQQGVGRKGRELLAHLASELGVESQACFQADAVVEIPGGSTASAAEFVERCASLDFREMLTSGPTVSGLAAIEFGAWAGEAGFVAELDSDGEQITRLRWFWET